MTTNWKHPTMLYALVCAAKGNLSASEIGSAWGLSRCAVIGIWARAHLPPITEDQLHEISSRAHKAAWVRRKGRAA